jgi:hypothetical protein
MRKHMRQIINTLLDPVVNFGKVIVSTGYNNTDTSITLATGDGFKLPNPVPDGSFNLVWFNGSVYSNPADDPHVEIVRCIARVGDTLTLMRGQENTSASNKNTPESAYNMILPITKKTITDIQTEYQSGVSTHANNTTTAHGVTGAVVGTTNSQVLTNKTLTTPTIDSFVNANHTHAATGVTGGVIDHVNLANNGTNTHAQIDTALTASAGHIAASGASVHSLGTMSTQASNNVSITGGTISVLTTDLAVTNGGTGASDAPTARSNLGLGALATLGQADITCVGATITPTYIQGNSIIIRDADTTKVVLFNYAGHVQFCRDIIPDGQDTRDIGHDDEYGHFRWNNLLVKTVLANTAVFSAIPTAANNAAAASAGVVVGGLYRTSADPSVLCIRSV